MYFFNMLPLFCYLDPTELKLAVRVTLDQKQNRAGQGFSFVLRLGPRTVSGTYQLPVLVDDVKLMGENLKSVTKQIQALLWDSWEVGLEMLRKLSACWCLLIIMQGNITT